MLKISAIFILFYLGMSDLFGVDTSLPPNLSWEAHSEGIAFAVVLDQSTDQKPLADVIRFYIKNISNKNLQYSHNDLDNDCQIIIIDGASIYPLHPRHEGREGLIETHVLMAILIKPGDTISFNIKLSSNDLSKVISFPIKCQFHIFDPVAFKDYLIESKPGFVQHIPTSSHSPQKS